MEREIRVVEDLAALGRTAAQAFRNAAALAVEHRGAFNVALSGGRTPLTFHHALAAPGTGPIPWERIHIFWGDERCVPPDDEASNFRMARESLLEHVPVPEENVHPIHIGSGGASEAAEAYERTLRAHFGEGAVGTFDLVVLGLGEDGHTASLFPDDEALDESRRWVVAVEAPAYRPPRDRITLTLPALNLSREAFFLVSGRAKRATVSEVLRSKEGGGRTLPASMIGPRERLVWFLDADAAPPDLHLGWSQRF